MTLWSKESEESCILELSRRSNAACQWRATTFRRAIQSEEPLVGSKLQCFHNRMTGFADWAQLFRNEGTGAWYAVLHSQVDGGDIARRTFGKRQVVRLGELLDKYEEIRVNNGEKNGGASERVEAVFEDLPIGDLAEKRKKVWKKESASTCMAELRRRLGGRALVPGDELKLIDTTNEEKIGLLECGNADGAPWFLRLAEDGSQYDLGELLDAYPKPGAIVSTSSSRKTKAIMRPPPKKLNVEALPSTEPSESQTLQDEDDRQAFELFLPVVATSRNERARLDAQAEDYARQITQAACRDGTVDSPTVCTTPPRRNTKNTHSTTHKKNAFSKHRGQQHSAPSTYISKAPMKPEPSQVLNNIPHKDNTPSKNTMNLLARDCARKASRSYFTGMSLRRPADALYDAVLDQRKRQPWNATPSVSVAFAISRAALEDRTTAPGAVFDAIADAAVFEGTDAAADAVDLVAEFSLAALFRYHPALFAHRDTAVATLEACDQALLGDDYEDEDNSIDSISVLRKSKRAQREKRYQAVLAVFLYANNDDGSAEAVRLSLDSRRSSAVDDFLIGADDERGHQEEDESQAEPHHLLNDAYPKKQKVQASVETLRSVRRKRTARGKLRIMVQTLENIANELAQAKAQASPSSQSKQSVASDDLMPALCDCIKESALARSEIKAQLAFAKRFNRDPKLLLGADGYALTSFEIALAALDQPPETKTDPTPTTTERQDTTTPPPPEKLQEPKPINPRLSDRSSAWNTSSSAVETSSMKTSPINTHDDSFTEESPPPVPPNWRQATTAVTIT